MSDLKITDVKVFTVKCFLPFDEDDYWEERLARPVDIYSEYDVEGVEEMYQMPLRRDTSAKELETTNTFVEITTDSDITGLAPTTNESGWMIRNLFRHHLVGKDPISIERAWDQLFRINVHGRKGFSMIALSAVDCALWDVVGKVRGEPVYRLLGGPVKDKIRAYASCLGYSLDPKLVAERAQMYADEGYTAMKWFFRWGPNHGLRGEERNIELVSALRDAVGYDLEIMLDCWQSWNVNYTIKMAKKLYRYEPTWIEEPLMGDMVDETAQIKAAVDIPISGGEHEYTRWGFMNLARKNALDIWQPDVTWAGGISEVTKICAIASSAGIPVIPHSGNAPISQHIWFSQNEVVTPIAEYLVKWNPIRQAPFREQLTPDRGYIRPCKKPGLGIEIDESRIAQKTYAK